MDDQSDYNYPPTLEALKRKDRKVWEDFCRYMEPKLINFLKRYVHDNTISDISQETFKRAFLFISTFKGNSEIETWICKISINIINANYRRELQRRRTNNEVHRQVEDWVVNSLHHCRPNDLVSIQQFLDFLKREAENLPPKRRQAFLNSLQDNSISNLNDYKPSYTNLSRARKTLKEKWKDLRGF